VSSARLERLVPRPTSLLTAAVFLAAWAALLGMVLTREGLAEEDGPILGWLVNHRTSGWTTALEAVSSGAAVTVVVLVTVGVASAAALARRSWRPLATVALVGGSAVVTSSMVKALVARSRPATSVMLGAPETGYGFPSGHTLITSALVGAAALVVWRATVQPLLRTAAVLTAGLVALAMGASRLYLGDHWFTDVLAAYALAGAVLAVAAWLTGGRAWRQAGPGTPGRRLFGRAATAAS
jgi:membrane-associated phospholipid phosphatase